MLTSLAKITSSSSRRTSDDEHPVFNRPCGRIVEKATAFDRGGAYFDTQGNPLLNISRTAKVNRPSSSGDLRHLSRSHRGGGAYASKISRDHLFYTNQMRDAKEKDEKRRRQQKYEVRWNRNLKSHLPLANISSSERAKNESLSVDDASYFERKPAITIRNEHRRLLSGSSVRSCLVGDCGISDSSSAAASSPLNSRRHLRQSSATTLFNDPAFEQKRGRGSRKAFEHARCESREVDDGAVASARGDVHGGGTAAHRNESRSVAIAINGGSSHQKMDNLTTQKRHYVGVDDYKYANTPKKRVGESCLQGLRNVLPKGKAQAHRVLVHVFRKHDLDFNGQVDSSAFRRGISSLGVGWTHRQVGAVLREIDAHKTGYVDYGNLADRVVELSRAETGKGTRATNAECRRRTGRRQNPAAQRRWEAARARWENRSDGRVEGGDACGNVRILRLAGGVAGGR